VGHGPGRCTTYGIGAHRTDGDPLSCANNTAAQPLQGPALAKLQAVCPQLAADVGAAGGSSYCCTEQQLDQLQQQVGCAAVHALHAAQHCPTAHAAHFNRLYIQLRSAHPNPPLQIQVASIFLVGCPACNHNFKHFFCLLTCSPDQAAFANVTAAQTANDTGASNAVAEMGYFVAGGQAWRAGGWPSVRCLLDVWHGGMPGQPNRVIPAVHHPIICITIHTMQRHLASASTTPARTWCTR